ncbi:hypothetical protein OG453_44695 [Streptomyces sp. NBC_01381]|uniref:hypothetical protein n=1 Tax=Streptomyces sp. NBC_01381 TaxID=2903845 RepID=UPI002252CFE9|nr:hypothetical protein [Streptomyces sp. NBC_01381]MCX4673658.1 hypothetical protein [Streptomyces sp. NBC_01381]
MTAYGPAERWTPGTRPRRPAESWTPGTPPGEHLWQAWQVGRCATVRVTGADVVRITASLADAVRTLLEERKIPLGPVLDTRPRGAVEFTVPAGTSATWPPLPDTQCVSEAELRCPAPDVTAASGRRVGGRCWILSPSHTPHAVTDANALREAVTTALAHRRDARADTPPSRPGGRG